MFQNYKPFLVFLARFFCSYLLLTLLYANYLDDYDVKKNQIDGITQHVGRSTEQILLLFDDQAYVEKNLFEPSLKTVYRGKYVSRIIEGCNAFSVIILFIAFVIAFRGTVFKTLLFVVFGGVLIYFSNILRIVFLNILLYHFPKYEHVLHGVLFPLVIYGIVFGLWVVWVNKFSFHANNITK